MLTFSFTCQYCVSTNRYDAFVPLIMKYLKLN